MITIENEEAKTLLELMKARFLKAHLNTAMYGAAAYANGNSDRVILRAVKNGDAPELKILMATMGLIPEEEDNIEKTA
ncbi:hypothetical protein ACLH2P_18415 [Klebsiella michiganensis]